MYIICVNAHDDNLGGILFLLGEINDRDNNKNVVLNHDKLYKLFDIYVRVGF